MDIKSSVKHRRQVRIKEILEKRAPGENLEFQTHKPAVKNGKVFDDIQQPRLSKPDTDTLPPEMEPDPEKLWKQGYRGWYDASPDAPPPRKKFSFVGSMLRRLTVSALLFGAVWGIFSIQEPWAVRAQLYIMDSLSREMDFQAAQTWYEEHFGGAPSFIPIFGQSEQDTTKVNGSVSLTPPLNGRIVQSFAMDMKGILIVPKEDSQSSPEVKSVETGRVLEVKKLQDSTFSVLIQHTGRRTALYSGLAASALKVNDWVQGGDVVGTLPAESGGEQRALYFMLKEGDRTVDPADVISF